MTRPSARRGRPPGSLSRTDVVGRRFGQRVIVEEIATPGPRQVRVRCDCGAESVLYLQSVRLTRGCKRCTRRVPRRQQKHRPHLEELLRDLRARCPEVWCSDEPEAVEAVREMVGVFAAGRIGRLTLHEIGVLLGVSRERVRQIQDLALRRMRLRCELAQLAPSPDPEPGLWDQIDMASLGDL